MLVHYAAKGSRGRSNWIAMQMLVAKEVRLEQRADTRLPLRDLDPTRNLGTEFD